MELSTINLQQLEQGDLLVLQRMLVEELARRKVDSEKAAIRQIDEVCKQVGVPLHELIETTSEKRNTGPKPGTKVAVRYQHPDKKELQWTGRGRQPVWVQEWLKAGGTIDQLDLLKMSPNLSDAAQ